MLDVDLDEMFDVEKIEIEVVWLKCVCDVFGVVNLCVEEDVCEVEVEYDGLVKEKFDLEEVVKMLCIGIVLFNWEGCEWLLMVFE